MRGGYTAGVFGWFHDIIKEVESTGCLDQRVPKVFFTPDCHVKMMFVTDCTGDMTSMANATICIIVKPALKDHQTPPLTDQLLLWPMGKQIITSWVIIRHWVNISLDIG